MSADQLKQTKNNQKPQPVLPGNGAVKNPLSDESALLHLYRDITQENESQARSVFMFVARDHEDSDARQAD